MWDFSWQNEGIFRVAAGKTQKNEKLVHQSPTPKIKNWNLRTFKCDNRLYQWKNRIGADQTVKDDWSSVSRVNLAT